MRSTKYFKVNLCFLSDSMFHVKHLYVVPTVESCEQSLTEAFLAGLEGPIASTVSADLSEHSSLKEVCPHQSQVRIHHRK